MEWRNARTDHGSLSDRRRDIGKVPEDVLFWMFCGCEYTAARKKEYLTIKNGLTKQAVSGILIWYPSHSILKI